MEQNLSILAYIPSPPQGVWIVGGFPLFRAYGICIVLGIIIALWMSTKRYVARGGKESDMQSVAIIVVISGIIGARAYHVLTDNQKYFCTDCDPMDVFKLSNGGLSIIGAVIGALIGAWLYTRKKNLSFALLADSIAPTILIGQAIGRFGNYFNQEVYGNPTDLPWGLEIYMRVNSSGVVDMMYGRSNGTVLTVVHPTFLYEALWNLAAAALLLWLDKKYRYQGGVLMALYIMFYSFGRFWIELMRADEATHILGLRVNTITTAVTFAIGFILFFVLCDKKNWYSLKRLLAHKIARITSRK